MGDVVVVGGGDLMVRASNGRRVRGEQVGFRCPPDLKEWLQAHSRKNEKGAPIITERILWSLGLARHFTDAGEDLLHQVEELAQAEGFTTGRMLREVMSAGLTHWRMAHPRR